MEKIEVLFENEEFRLEKISSFGCVSPENFWYDQQETETVTIVSGSAKLTFFDNKTITLNKGDSLTILPFVKHKVSYTSPDCVWACLFIK